MTLGSLFDGSGGFPLAGAINGITPLWASEIEPYPLRVTKARFPSMKHIGNVLDVKGDEIAPVDIITFGSPCQDLSVAGKQKGIHEGERSNLFFEAIRIIKEMRNHDRAAGRTGVDVRPRFAVWENVPGAFSSNKGEDFQAVLQAFCDIEGEDIHVPGPPKGKWSNAGCIVGDGFSVAWRVYDAQYWGVPQRRKRIYLVADFAGERAGEILFEREGMPGNSQPCKEAREGATADAEGSAGGSCTAFHLQQDPINGEISPCIGGQHQATVGVVASFKGGQGSKAGSIGYQERQAPTLTSTNSGTNAVPDVVYALKGNAIDRDTAQNGKLWSDGASYTLDATDRHGICFPSVARTLTAEHDASPCIDRGQNVVALDCRNLAGNTEVSGTLQAKNDGGYSLNYQNPVVYSSGSYGTLSKGVGTLGTGSRATAEMLAVYDTTQITSPQNGCNPKPGDPCHPLAAQQHPPLMIEQNVPPRSYIVRRLTPLECCRLQGFPDWWEDGVEGSDSARYKMWGNGIALPCAVDVLCRIARAMAEQWAGIAKLDTPGAVNPC